MLIAKEKEEQNIVEYILYMWQMEDLVRGSGMNLDTILRRVFPGATSDEQKEEYTRWFADLVTEMNNEGLQNNGHIKGVRTYMKSIDSLHHSLVTVYQDTEYLEIHQRAADHIQELRRKAGSHTMPETEVCLVGLYGYLMLKMSGSEISPDTEKAMKEISALMAYLAESFNKLKRGELKLPPRMNN